MEYTPEQMVTWMKLYADFKENGRSQETLTSWDGNPREYFDNRGNNTHRLLTEILPRIREIPEKLRILLPGPDLWCDCSSEKLDILEKTWREKYSSWLESQVIVVKEGKLVSI